MRDNFYVDNHKLLEKEANSWLDLFTNTFAKKHVTPYMHMFSSHMCFFVETHGDVDIYNLQGLEKLNDQTTGQFFRGTNRKTNYLYQIMCYRNRTENYKSSSPNVINKKLKINKQLRLKMKLIRKQMLEEEADKRWCQFVFGKYVLKNDEIQGFGSGECGTDSVNVVEAALSLFNKSDVLILDAEMWRGCVLEGTDMKLVDGCDLKAYRAIVGVIVEEGKQSSLVYVCLKERLVYYVNPCSGSSNEATKKEFLNKWM